MTDTPTTEKPKGLRVKSLFGSDAALSEDGKWFDDFPLPTLSIKMRRPSSIPATLARNEFLTQHTEDFVANVVKDDDDEEKRRVAAINTARLERQMRIEMLVKGIIVDWKGFLDDDDNELPCTPANVREVLEAVPEFVDMCIDRVSAIGTFKTEALLGNS